MTLTELDNKLNEWRDTLLTKQAEINLLTRELAEEKQQVQQYNQAVADRVAAQAIIQSAAELTQKTLEEKLSTITSAALAAVFPHDPYKFLINFVARRGSTECEFFFERHGEHLRLFADDTGFGAIDVGANALRIAYLNATGSRKLLIIDEPYKNLSKKYLERAAQVISELCHKMNLQIIMITHIQEFADIADRVFTVVQGPDGVSQVTQF